MISERTYFLFVSMAMFLTGLMMFLFVMITRVDMMGLDVLSSPLFYLVSGFMFLGLSYVERRTAGGRI